MKVLFAVSDDNISESIVKEYQKQYKEIISFKNVYYFNAIIKELQKDKSYDRIVISEDLEPFASNNYDSIDKFIFEKLDSISDEAIDVAGKDTQIILITTDRRNFGDEMLVKFFGIGIYSALVGRDKSIENVCDLIKRPRSKKEAKLYYKIDSDSVNYQTERENDVSETEIQNILAHYKKLGKNTDKYVESFDNIVSQYSDEQLKIIINFLPVGVKAVLEAESPKYQELVMNSKKGKPARKPNTTQYTPPKIEAYKPAKPAKGKNSLPNLSDVKIDILENRNTTKLTKPVVIPTEVESKPVRKATMDKVEMPKPVTVDIDENDYIDADTVDTDIVEEFVEAPKKGRGRPKKAVEPEFIEVNNEPKRGRGRPKKNVEPEIELKEDEDEEIDLFDLPEKPQINLDEDVKDELDLFDLSDNEDSDEKVNEEDDFNLFDLEDEKDDDEEEIVAPKIEDSNATIKEKMNAEHNNTIMKQKFVASADISNLLTSDKKIVSFVGTTKNGTSFIINNLAELFSSMGISTAILDMTQSRNDYYIYTDNNEQLRNIADKCINNLRSNIPEGIKVNKNLTVYSAIPGTRQNVEDVENILSTLLENYSLVLIDCDFETPTEYFYQSQEIYLVQSMDVLTIQPLTAFLRDLKYKNALDTQKLKIVINKETRVGGLSPKMIIGGMSAFNDPSMSISTELFDRSKIKYVTIPFETQNYSAYLEAMLNCKITLKRYTKQFNSKIRELGNLVYPLLGQRYGKNVLNKKY